MGCCGSSGAAASPSDGDYLLEDGAGDGQVRCRAVERAYLVLAVNRDNTRMGAVHPGDARCGGDTPLASAATYFCVWFRIYLEAVRPVRCACLASAATGRPLWFVVTLVSPSVSLSRDVPPIYNVGGVFLFS